MNPPPMLYGTAWKEDATEECVVAALAAGFRGIDTANQRKHYFEAGVGAGIARSGVPRAELWLQTKFTFRDGQDHRLPYDETAPIAIQVAQSFEKSLEHLGTDYLDSLVLHGPSRGEGLGPEDHEAWRAMEELHAQGRVRALGVSNVVSGQIDDLAAFAKVPISFVQNRCYADKGWGTMARRACEQHGITYQAFSLLTANRWVLATDAVRAMAKRHGVGPAQIVLRFAQQVGMLPLTGTKDPEHMSADLAIAAFELAPDELDALVKL